MKTRISAIAIATVAASLATAPASASTGRVSFTVDTQAPTATIEVESWSWGVSQTSNASPRRDAATGLASGKRMHKPYRVGGPYDFDGSVTIVTPQNPATGMRKGWDGCVKGNHFAKIELSGATEKVSLSDLTIMSCTADGMVLSYATATDLPPDPASAVVKSKSNITNN